MKKVFRNQLRSSFHTVKKKILIYITNVNTHMKEKRNKNETALGMHL